VIEVTSIQSCYYKNVPSTGQKVARSFPDKATAFFDLPNPSSYSMALGSTQSLTQMGTRDFPVCKGRLACNVDNLTALKSHNPMRFHGMLQG
jgi:hypothetical protein